MCGKYREKRFLTLEEKLEKFMKYKGKYFGRKFLAKEEKIEKPKAHNELLDNESRGIEKAISKLKEPN